jgi:hypothetical protein
MLLRRYNLLFVWVIFVILVTLTFLTLFPVTAGSTTKSLSTNFTLINLGSSAANGVIQYLRPDGTEWRTSETFTIEPYGGQAIFRQYMEGPGYIATPGQGSVIVSADQPLAAVVQIRALGQIPTSGAYVGFPTGSDTFYVPLVARQRGTASGIANSQIIIQNTGTEATNIEIKFIDWFNGNLVYTKTGITVNRGASYLYDLADEVNLPSNWIGSAVVKATTEGGSIAVVSNFFTGPHGMQTFNAFPKESVSREWVIPLFTSRLANGLSAPVTIQNLSDSVIPIGGAVMTCTVDSTSPNPTPTTFVVSNTTPISPSMAYAWNPVIDMSLPSQWLGSCRVSSLQDIIAFVQLRFIGTDKAAAYEAIDARSAGKTVFVPLVAKRLPNGFASAVTIQNLNINASANVTLTYKATLGYSPSELVLYRVIPAGGSLIQNHRVGSDHPQGVPLPDNWQGSLIVESDQPIAAFVQLDFLGSGGDPYMAHNAFTIP